MKRLYMVFFAAILALCPICAALAAIPPQPLPDPNEAAYIGDFKLIASDLMYAEDYTCDAYLYNQPKDFDGFLGRYAELAAQRRYRMEETVLDGVSAYALISYWTAYLIPDYQPGKMLLLVEDHIEFDGAARCASCHEGFIRCRQCEGRGYIKRETSGADESGRYERMNRQCYSCGGDGYATCRSCDGTGVTGNRRSRK